MNLSSLIKPFGSQSFLIGLGVAAAAYLIGPQIKEALKPVAVKGTQGVMSLSEKTKEVFNQGKEKVSSAFEKAGRMDKTVSGMGDIGAILEEFKKERVQSNKMLEELKNTIADLKGEIAGMNNKGGAFQEG